MPYSIKDKIGFPPPAPPPKIIDFKTLVDIADSSSAFPVAYTFGGNAPTELTAEQVADYRQGGAKIGGASDSNSYGRMFVEDRPYYWNPNSPDWNGT